jgi:hypothetical protein
MAKHSEDGSRTSREELAGNKSSEQEQDLMASPMPLRGVKGHTTTTTTNTTTTTTTNFTMPVCLLIHQSTHTNLRAAESIFITFDNGEFY